MITELKIDKQKPWKILFIIFFIGISSTVTAQVPDSTAGKTVNQNKFQRLVNKKNTVLLDVRTDVEYNAGHIPGAVQADVLKPDNFKNQIAGLDKNKNYLLYCKSGKRSSQAKFIMKEMGFKKLKDLKGGYSQWTGKKEVK